MFGTRRRLSLYFISTRILYCSFYYTICLGVIFFWLKRARCDGRLVARRCTWFKWISVLIRIPISYAHVKFYRLQFHWNFSHMDILTYSRVLGCLIFAIVIIVMQVLYGQQVIRVTNSFLKLFRRANALPSVQNMAMEGNRELTLLFFKTLTLLYELYFMISLISESNSKYIVYMFCEVYTSLCSITMFHVCFLGYLCVGALYDRTNSYVRNELQQQLKELEQSHGGEPSHRQLKAAARRLDECLSIYDEIQRVAMNFHNIFDLVLGLILLVGFLNMATLSYLLLINRTYIVQIPVALVKIFVDVLLLILAIHGAHNSSKVVRRLSLENYYVCERNDWHLKLDVFLNRLNFYEFRVRPLGLFEVSNELILVFFSGMVTYLTYILQYSMHSERI